MKKTRVVFIFIIFFIFFAALESWGAPKIIIDTDFGAAAFPVSDVSPDGAKRITGSLPVGWIENSGWNKEIVVSYTPQEEQGRRFLRVQKRSGGPSQLAFYMGNVPEETFYRLELTARSEDNTSFTIGIRDAGPPYAFHWQTQPPLQAQWQDFSYEFRLDPLPQRIGVWINLAENASYDIARLKLIARTREEVVAELESQFPVYDRKNLVRTWTFLLGLPSGWALDRDNSDGDQIVVLPDAQTKGPRGVAALCVKGSARWRLWTAPVSIPRSFEPHTASIYARGTGKLRLTAYGDGRYLRSAEFVLKPQSWERAVLTFNPLLLGQFHQLTIEGEGDVWLDAFQIERGSEATEFVPPQPCLVALALPESAASAARIQFADEPPQILYAVHGAPPGSVLKLTQYDLYGGALSLPEIKNPPSQGRLQIKPPAAHGLGTFRVEAYVQDAQGRIISPVEEIVLHRVRRPRYWNKPAPRSPFGVHTNSTRRHILMAKAIGANWTRLHDAGTEYIGWAHLEPEPGKWIFRDRELQRYAQYGMKILGLLSTSPLWANYQEKPRHGYFDRYVQPKDLAQFANYVRVVTKRYLGLIDSYDVWNEPWGTSFWSLGWDFVKNEFKRSPTAAEDYARLQKTAYEAAKAISAQLTILGFNTYGAANGYAWTSDLLQYNALEACDAICYHHYSHAYNGYPGDDVCVAWDMAVGPILKQAGALPKPVWMTEGSPTSSMLNNGFYHHTMCGQPTDDNWAIANRLCRYIISLLSCKVEKLFLYTMHGHGPAIPKTADWRVLVEDDGYMHPCGVAHAHLAWLLEDTKFVERKELVSGVFAYIFVGAHRAVAVLSSKPGHADYVVPAARNVELTDLFGNPVSPRTKLKNNLIYLSAPTLHALKEALKI